MATFSKKPGALPVLAVHGWPGMQLIIALTAREILTSWLGSFMEFAPMMSLLREKYTPETLPFSLIAVSMPGYTFSSSPPPEVEPRTDIASRLFNQLMTTLGYGQYVVQGGDIGAGIARNMGALFDNCKGAHGNTPLVPSSMFNSSNQSSHLPSSPQRYPNVASEHAISRPSRRPIALQPHRHRNPTPRPVSNLHDKWQCVHLHACDAHFNHWPRPAIQPHGPASLDRREIPIVDRPTHSA